MIATETNRRPAHSSSCPACGQSLPSTSREMPPSSCPGCRAWEDLLLSMRYEAADLWQTRAIIPDLEANTSHEAIHEIVQAMSGAEQLSEALRDSILAALFLDEETASIAVDHGLAILHVTQPAVSEPMATVARSRRGINFAARDGVLAKVIVLLVTPRQSPSTQLRTLAAVAGYLRDFGRRAVLEY